MIDTPQRDESSDNDPPPPEIMDWLRRQYERPRQLGHVRPMIWVDGEDGLRFVAVGGRLCWGKNWRTFPDFLHRYCLLLLGREWHAAERQKPRDKWHLIVQWYQEVGAFYKRMSAGVDKGELFSAIATGPVMAHATLAYDLYVLEHHRLLRRSLVERLKDLDQFQGARYEAYVTASFVRAGFRIALEDETDRTTSHCEFAATHRNGAKYSVEAKSRHRGGILGRGGPAPSFDTIVADVSTLLVKALRKHAPHERIVFIDVNVPPHDEPLLKSSWFKRVATQLKRLEESLKGNDALPRAFLFFTNHPYHYVSAEAEEPGKAAIFTAINIPEFKRGPDTAPEVVGAEVIASRIAAEKYPEMKELSDSVFNHSNIPQAFEGDDAWCPPGTI